MKAALQRLRAALDRVALYLPLLVMGLLALGSWSLVRSVPNLLSTPATSAVRNTPDYALGRFTVQAFDAEGRLMRELSGERARHYPANDELHIDQVRIRGTSATGVRVQASALSGVAPGNGSTIALSGQVLAVREADRHAVRTELKGERLLARLDEDRLLANSPVLILRGPDRFAADRMDFNSRTGQYDLDGRVRVTLSP